MGSKRGRPSKTAKSATRADSLRGRKTTRNNRVMYHRRAECVALRNKPRADPSLKRLPREFFNVVFRRKSDVSVCQMRGRILDIKCADCRERLAIDGDLQKSAESKPERETRAMRYICRQCFWEYFEGFEDSRQSKEVQHV